MTLIWAAVLQGGDAPPAPLPAVEANYRSALQHCERADCAERPVLLQRLGRLLYLQGRAPEAQRMLERALELGETPAVLVSLAEACRENGDATRAETLIRRALAISPTPEAQGVLGGVLAAAGKLDEAAIELEAALVSARARQPLDRVALAEALNNLGMVRHNQDRVNESAAYYEESLDLLKDQARHPARPAVLNNLATVRAAQGRFKEASALFRQAIELWERLYGAQHPHVGAALGGLAIAEQRQGHWQEAERLLLRAYEVDRQSFAPGHPRIALALHNRGVLAAERKRFPEAVSLLEQAAALYRDAPPRAAIQQGRTLVNLGSVYASLKQWGPSARSLSEGLEVLERHWGTSDSRLLKWVETYAQVLRQQEDFAAAARQDMQAMRIRVVNTLR